MYICDFHREQAWGRWLAKTSNGMSDLKPLALTAMRKIARAKTVQEYERNVNRIKSDTQLWSEPLFVKWFEKVWLKHHHVSNDSQSTMALSFNL